MERPSGISAQQLPFEVRDLGRMSYADAYALQRELQEKVIARRDESRANLTDENPGAMGYVLLVEHDPPVITVSRRKSAREHLVATPQMLAQHGVEVTETDRGGDITYHGPGQLVVYPILDLNRLGLRLHGYMRFLEQAVIDTLAKFGIEAMRDETATGVWVPQRDATAPSPPGGQHSAKICAIGVRVTRWVSMHGLALNVTTNLDHFNLIVPCGLVGRPVTSMKMLLRDHCPTMQTVKDAMIRQVAQAAEGSARTSR